MEQTPDAVDLEISARAQRFIWRLHDRIQKNPHAEFSIVTQTMQTLGTMDMEQAAAADVNSAALIEMHRITDEVLAPKTELPPLPLEALELLEKNTDIAGIFVTAANQLNEEVGEREKAEAANQTLPSTPLLDKALTLPEVPAHQTMRWAANAAALIGMVSETLDYMSLCIVRGLPKGRMQENNVKLDRDQSVTELLISLITDPQINMSEVTRSPWAAQLVKVHRNCQYVRSILPHWVWSYQSEPEPEPEAVTTPPSENEEELRLERIAAAHTELAQLIELHTDHTRSMRPTWAQMNKLGLRPFSTDLIRVSRSRANNVPELPAPDAKRLTGLLHALECLGSKPDTVYSKFSTLIADEHSIGVSILRASQELRRHDKSADIPEWHPVQEDIRLLRKHWDVFEPRLEEHWIARKPSVPKPQAIEAISVALRAFQRARLEFTHPERRLEGIALSLGAVALPPDAQPKTHTTSQKIRQEATRDAVQYVIEDEALSTNVRQRAEVIRHFMDLGASQRSAEASELGELYLSDIIPPANIRYFSVTFRAPNNSEWALLESLVPDTATFVIPMELVRDYGTLAGFVQDFGKQSQRELGSQHVIHISDWSAASHIERIMTKITS